MFIHIIQKDTHNKFIRPVVEQFETANPKNNLYLVFEGDEKFIKALGFQNFNDNIKCITNKNDLIKIFNTEKEWQGVVLSGLSLKKNYRELLSIIPKNLGICYASWGNLVTKPFYGKYTKNEYVINNSEFFKKILYKTVYKSNIVNFIYNYIKYGMKKKKICKMFDVFSSINFEEFVRCKKEKLFNNSIEFMYGTIGANKFETNFVNQKTFDNIQVGNSGSKSNNHLDAFEFLNNFDLTNRKIIVPLSYGEKKYIDFVIKKGEELFKNSFLPIIDFMPLKDYEQLMSTCGVYVNWVYGFMALGNVNMGIRRGAKLILPKNSLIYNDYKNKGFKIFSFDDIVNNADLNVLEQSDIKWNRRVYMKYLSYEKKIEYTSLMLKRLEEITQLKSLSK